MGVEILFINCKFLTGIIYRPQKSKTDKLNNLAISWNNAIDTALSIFLMGDFNIDTLSCGNNVFKHHDTCISWENWIDEQSTLLESIQMNASRTITCIMRNSSQQYTYQELC